MPKKVRKKIGIRKKVYKAKKLGETRIDNSDSELWHASPPSETDAEDGPRDLMSLASAPRPSTFKVTKVGPGQSACTSVANMASSGVVEEGPRELVPTPASRPLSAFNMKNYLAEIFSIVKNGITPEWLALQVAPGIQLVELYCGAICQIKRSIFFFNDGRFTVNIHNMPLPLSSDIWLNSKVFRHLLLAKESPLDIAKIILKITGLVSRRVCPGNFEATYEHLWHHERYSKAGTVEYNYSLQPTFRVFDCELLAAKTKCHSCLRFRKALQVQHSRKNKKNKESEALENRTPGGPSDQQQSSCDSSNTSRPGLSMSSSTLPNSMLPVSGMREKLSACASEIKKLRSQVAYRDKKIAQDAGS